MLNWALLHVFLLTAYTIYGFNLNYTHNNSLFASDIYTLLASKNEDFLASPLLLESTLALILFDRHNTPFEKYEEHLHWVKNKTYLIKMFREIYLQFPVRDPIIVDIDFKMYMKTDYRSSVAFKELALSGLRSSLAYVNFSDTDTIKNINEWISLKSKKLISSIAKVPSDTILAIVNVLVISGAWLNPFEDTTAPLILNFYVNDTYSVPVNMLSTFAVFNYHYDELLDVKYLDLPLRDNDTTVTFIVPNTINGLQKVEPNILQVIENTKRNSIPILARIPRFNLKSNVDWNTINEMFIEQPPESEIDIRSGKDLCYTTLVQEAAIKIGLKGINLRDNIGYRRRSSFIPRLGPTMVFTADRPFIYIVRSSRTGILLLGKYTNPQEM